MDTLILDQSQARKIVLHAAGLAKPAQFGRGKEAVFKLIDHLGYVQLDTNSTVERAHHHTIFARVPDYRTEWLTELQADSRIFEYLTSDSGFIPVEDYRFTLPSKKSFTDRYAAISAAEKNAMDRVLSRIEREGPLMLKDFENDRMEASSGWWDWRPAKVALERLYFSGQLMVTRDKTFHKIYDLPNNLVPRQTDRTEPSAEEFARFCIGRFLKALGIAAANELAWKARFAKNNLVKKELEKMTDEGKVLRIAIDGKKTRPLYMLPTYRNKKISILDTAFILSPFDPLNVFRQRLKEVFDFDYQVECFVPAPKRKYGYFSLPVLLGDRFIARMDSKAERKEAVLTIHNLHFEEDRLNDDDLSILGRAMSDFAVFNQCRRITVSKTNKPGYLKKLKPHFTF
ncbi:MAG: winged helix-turn-helix domain-containing protein [Chitinophagaceae bacterium]|nr:MAG: winged helix-turn-helix domain-containing protein [Chitinophagaceae bacterium]